MPRNTDQPYQYPDFVCMKLLLPKEVHAQIIEEQHRLKKEGKKKNVSDVTVGIIKKGLTSEPS